MKPQTFLAGIGVGLALAGAAPTALNSARQGVEGSNQKIPQPQLIERSYPPLKTDADRTKSAKFCQGLTEDLLATFNNLKQSHWNLNGPLYLPLHEEYQQQADYYRGQADVFAERVLSLGYSVDGRYATIAKTTKISEMPPGFETDNDSLKLQIERQTQLQNEVYEGIKLLNDSDPVTANKLQDLAYQLDKNLWRLRIHVTKPGGLGQDLPYAPAQKGGSGTDLAAGPGKSGSGL